MRFATYALVINSGVTAETYAEVFNSSATDFSARRCICGEGVSYDWEDGFRSYRYFCKFCIWFALPPVRKETQEEAKQAWDNMIDNITKENEIKVSELKRTVKKLLKIYKSME